MSAHKVRWGRYRQFEGPWYPGDIAYTVDNPNDVQKIALVVTATEGGHLDAINRYDKCIDTQGFIQWCNRAPQQSVDGMYQKIYERNPIVLQPVLDALRINGYTFSATKGMFVHGTNGLVDTPSRQQTMYFYGSTGLYGQWTEETKVLSKTLVSAAAEVWHHPIAQAVQVEYTISRLRRWFIFGKEANFIIDSAEKRGDEISKAFIAMYISFAANNPKKASEALHSVLQEIPLSWDDDWLATVAKHLTFDPGVAIYPHRYNKIRPVIEELYGVDLPDVSEELKVFKREMPEQLMDPLELQRALGALGYDLGPRGADGVFGAKSKSALKEFELDAGVPPHLVDGILDSWTLRLIEKALERKGLTALGTP